MRSPGVLTVGCSCSNGLRLKNGFAFRDGLYLGDGLQIQRQFAVQQLRKKCDLKCIVAKDVGIASSKVARVANIWTSIIGSKAIRTAVAT